MADGNYYIIVDLPISAAWFSVNRMSFDKYPISEYYKPHVIEASTISRTEKWWIAIVKIKMPKARKPFVTIYKWQHRGERGWKVSSKFKFRSNDESKEIIMKLTEMLEGGAGDGYNSEKIDAEKINRLRKYRR
jgi:hypothetical protein